MALVPLLLLLLINRGFVECKEIGPAIYGQDLHKQDEIGSSNGIKLCKRCFLGKVFRDLVKPVNNAENDTESKFDIAEMTNHNARNVDSVLKRRKRGPNCRYEFYRTAGKPFFTVKCNNDTDSYVPITTQIPTQSTDTSKDNVFVKLLKMLGYEVYKEKSSIQTSPVPMQRQYINNKKPNGYTRVNRGRKLTSAEIKQQQGKNVPGRRKNRKNRLNTKGMTSAEKKRAKKKRMQSGKTNKGRRNHHRKDYPLAGGISASSIWSSVVEPPLLPTIKTKQVTVKTPTQVSVTNPVGQTSVTEWWNEFKWLFNTSVIITLPDGTHWYFPGGTKQPLVVPVTKIPSPVTQQTGRMSPEAITSKNSFPVNDPVIPTLRHEEGLPATIKPPKPTETTSRDGAKYPVLRVSDSPSHKWYPDKTTPKHKWYADGVRPTESHTWFTATKKQGGSEKDIHKWFGQQTTKPVTSHNWFPEADNKGAGTHKWFGQENNNSPGDGTYWWWGSAYKLFIPQEISDLNPQLSIPENLLQKLLKIVRVDSFPK